MLDLSPAKLLVIVIVVVILLGPDKLPQVAKQMGAGMRKLRAFQQRVDQEVRENIPDLPSTQDIARFARSPITLINQWADDLVEDPAATAEPVGDDWPADPGAAELDAASTTSTSGSPAPAATAGPRGPSADPVVDDPTMN